MFDPDQVPLSTSEGRRPSSTAGDRMMVGLAVLALIGGLLIAVSRLLPEQPNQTSQASATPIASRLEASRTPRPTPSRGPVRTMTVDAVAIPSPAEFRGYVSEWVRLRTRVTLVTGPNSTALPSGVIRRGEAANVSEPPPEEGGAEGWLRVDGPVSGWIFGEIDNDAMFERFPYRWQSGSSAYGLAADAEGFTASAWVSDAVGEVMLTSPDGLHWRTSDLAVSAWGRAIAYGPAGWLMASNVDSETGPVIGLWQSPDRRSWQSLGTLTGASTNGTASLAGSEAGYVLTTYTGAGTIDLWFSADAQLWTERPMPSMDRVDGIRLVATPLGFFLWSDGQPSDDAAGAFSIDGWTWSEADFVGPGQIVDVVALGDHLLAVGRAPYGTPMWKGTPEGQELTWSPDNTAPFRGAGIGRMVSDGERVVVLGWDRDTEALLWWQRVGMSWQRHAMPEAFGTLPHDAAGGPHGMVAIGQTASDSGRTSVFWHLAEGGGWEREPSPIMRPPTPTACGPVPHDLLELMAIDGELAANCFGDAPIAIRGYSLLCEGCYGEDGGTWETEWLGQPADDRIIHLAPVEGDWGSFDGVLHPSLRGRPPPPSRWLRVTGHFDDPEASSCRWRPTVMEEQWYAGTYEIVARCRARFVVTSVHEVDGS